MRYAIFSDIHSNLEALETAVSHAEDQKIDSWMVLGDTVGYGANPNECFEWVIKNADLFIMGNHEKAVIDPKVREWFNPLAREAIIWTEGQMADKLKKEIQPLPFLKIDKNITWTHGSPDAPETFKYLTHFDDTGSSFKAMENDVCFVGHTHVPCCFCLSKKSAEYLKSGTVNLKIGDRYILNPGSVGQPRDRDPRLAYGIYDDQKRTFEIFRLDYKNEKAAEKIRKAGLPRYLADRLL